MIDEIISYKEQKLIKPYRDHRPEKIVLLITSLELGVNKDRLFSRHLMEDLLDELANLPGVIYTVLISEAIFMARKGSPFTKALLKLSERGELIIHSDSWKHYLLDEEPFIGKLRDMSYIATKLMIADKVITLR